MRQYYALALLEPRRELLFCREAKQNKLHCYVPLITKRTKPKGKHKFVFRSSVLLPGYAFVLIRNFNSDYQKARSSRGFRRFLFLNGDIVRIRKQDIWELKRREQKGEFGSPEVAENINYVLGEVVQIEEGPFLGISGPIIKFLKAEGERYVMLDCAFGNIKISLGLIGKSRQ